MKRLFFTAVAIAFLHDAGYAMKKAKPKTGSIQSVNVHHTTCFGRCPDYSIQIDKSGLVTFTGNRFTADTGVFTKNIGKVKAAEVLNMCLQYRLDTCTDVYENMIPDLPGLIYNIKYKKRLKKIVNANFGPMFLKEISARMSEVGTPDSTWKKLK